jgi:Helix-turn-helix domain
MATTTLKQRDDWMKAMLASKESAGVKLVALRLALYQNIKTGLCNPSYATLAKDADVSERSAIRAIAALEIEIVDCGRAHSRRPPRQHE